LPFDVQSLKLLELCFATDSFACELKDLVCARVGECRWSDEKNQRKQGKNFSHVVYSPERPKKFQDPVER
jgi:hypothetical protein